MSKIVTIDYFKLENPDFFLARHVEVVPPASEEWTRSYVYPRGVLAIGSVFSSLGKTFVRPVTNGVARLVHRSKDALYDGLACALEITRCIPTGKAEFGLSGETLSEYKVRHIRERHALVLRLKRNDAALNRDGIIAEIDDITRVLERVGDVQAARKGW